MKLQKLLSLTRKAIDTYEMIDDGDKIAVGVSGGKDSIALLYALKGLQRFYPKKFDFIGICVDLGFGTMDFDGIKALCDDLEVELTIVPTEISDIVFNERKESNPCSLCSKMRKGSLNDMAKQLGCNKVALGHNKDDFIETMLMSLLYNGKFHCFPPVTYLSRIDITAIRPLMYVYEHEIRAFIKKQGINPLKNACPADGATKREDTKELIKRLSIDMGEPKLPDRLFTAITKSNLEGYNGRLS